MLRIRNLKVRYGEITALHGISLDVPAQSIVTLIGANGAGKTTALKAISGLLKYQGDVVFDGQPLLNAPPHKVVKRGLCHVPEGRLVFANLTVKENLAMGAYLLKSKAVIDQQSELVFSVFPRLKERISQIAGTLSGGEQQMLAIGRALMGKPRFLMLDEPSLGIAPILVRTIFDKILEINRTEKISILLVEQNANLALEISQFGYVLETGRIILEGTSESLRNNDQVKAAYLGG